MCIIAYLVQARRQRLQLRLMWTPTAYEEIQELVFNMVVVLKTPKFAGNAALIHDYLWQSKLASPEGELCARP